MRTLPKQAEPASAPYTSALRAEQAHGTHERILDAFVAHLAQHGWDEFSISAVAKRAGVAEPTVYRHFPNRDALVLALRMRGAERLPKGVVPDRLDDLAKVVIDVFGRFAQNAELLRAGVRAGVGGEAREPGRHDRDTRFLAGFAGELDHLPPAESRALKAILRTMLSGEAWEGMTGRLRCDPDAVARMTGWAMKAITDAVARERARGERGGLRGKEAATARAKETRRHGGGRKGS